MKKIQKHVILGAAVLASTGFAHTVAAYTTPVDANTPANQDKSLSASPEAFKQQTEQVNQAKALRCRLHRRVFYCGGRLLGSVLG